MVSRIGLPPRRMGRTVPQAGEVGLDPHLRTGYLKPRRCRSVLAAARRADGIPGCFVDDSFLEIERRLRLALAGTACSAVKLHLLRERRASQKWRLGATASIFIRLRVPVP